MTDITLYVILVGIINLSPPLSCVVQNQEIVRKSLAKRSVRTYYSHNLRGWPESSVNARGPQQYRSQGLDFRPTSRTPSGSIPSSDRRKNFPGHLSKTNTPGKIGTWLQARNTPTNLVKCFIRLHYYFSCGVQLISYSITLNFVQIYYLCNDHVIKELFA